MLAAACGGKTDLDLYEVDASTGDAWVPDSAAIDASVMDAPVMDARVIDDAGTPAADGTDAPSVDAMVGDACGHTDCGVSPTALVEQEAYVKSADTQQNDAFGSTVAIDGDTMVVGAPWEMRGELSFGSIHVFVRSGGVWMPQSTLVATEGYGFGRAVSISRDTIATRDRFGSLFVFARSDGAWHREAFLDASSSAANFGGSAVAIDGDTLAFDAAVDNGADPAGRGVYVWLRSDGVWAQQAVFTAATSSAANDARASIAIANDTIVVGVVADSAAHVFTRSGGTWTRQGELTASNAEAQDGFGSSVAITADTIVVGAPAEASSATGVNGDQTDNRARDSGAVYVFVRNGTSWAQQAYLKASNNEASWYRGDRGELSGWGGDAFGFSVAISTDMVVVGAINEESASAGINGDQANNDDYGSGAAYVFVRAGASWSQLAYLKASNNAVLRFAGDERFGAAVAVSNGTIAVTAHREFSNATGINGDQFNTDAPHSGAVYVFRVTP